MSGGVDSSVAAALLKEQGHEVIGIMLRLWSEPGMLDDDGLERVVQNKCCSLEAVNDARRVARKLDIPFYLVNVEQEFKENVVDLFYQEYVAGRTPATAISASLCCSTAHWRSTPTTWPPATMCASMIIR
jgi:tRNA-specific 2-thiouridylase